MKIKLLIGFFIVLGVGFLLGFKIGKNVIWTKDQNVKPPSYNTQTIIKKINEDIDNDNKKEEIELAYTECYRKGDKGENRPVGCLGDVCSPADEFCERPYFEITVSGSKTNGKSEKVYSGGYAGEPIVAEITTAAFGKDTLLVVSPLDVGAHSSLMRIFKIDNGKVIPVCRNKVSSLWVDADKCAFFSDLREPSLLDLDNDGIPEIVEKNYDYKPTPRQVILNDVSVYDGNQFIVQEGEDYKKFLELVKKNNPGPFEIVSKTEEM